MDGFGSFFGAGSRPSSAAAALAWRWNPHRQMGEMLLFLMKNLGI
jgi:hypothetical protein